MAPRREFCWLGTIFAKLGMIFALFSWINTPYFSSRQLLTGIKNKKKKQIKTLASFITSVKRRGSLKLIACRRAGFINHKKSVPLFLFCLTASARVLVFSLFLYPSSSIIDPLRCKASIFFRCLRGKRQISLCWVAKPESRSNIHEVLHWVEKIVLFPGKIRSISGYLFIWKIKGTVLRFFYFLVARVDKNGRASIHGFGILEITREENLGSFHVIPTRYFKKIIFQCEILIFTNILPSRFGDYRSTL